MPRCHHCILTVVFVLTAGSISAETIRGIDGLDFVTIGNAGNFGDTRIEANPYNCGAVAYDYQIGKYEITNYQWNTFIDLAGAPAGNDGGYNRPPTYTGVQQPTNNVSWYKAIQLCNLLTSGDKSQGAYLFSGNNTNPGSFLGIDRDSAISTYGITYVIPTEDEWYKAAYYTGGGYSTYANGTDTAPIEDVDSNYDSEYGAKPWNVGSGTVEQNGTFDMMGNVLEWTETLQPSLDRSMRGGTFGSEYYFIGSSIREILNPWGDGPSVGFRIATVPEPCTVLLLGLGGLALRVRRSRWVSHIEESVIHG